MPPAVSSSRSFRIFHSTTAVQTGRFRRLAPTIGSATAWLARWRATSEPAAGERYPYRLPPARIDGDKGFQTWHEALMTSLPSNRRSFLSALVVVPAAEIVQASSVAAQ